MHIKHFIDIFLNSFILCLKINYVQNYIIFNTKLTMFKIWRFRAILIYFAWLPQFGRPDAYVCFNKQALVNDFISSDYQAAWEWAHRNLDLSWKSLTLIRKASPINKRQQEKQWQALYINTLKHVLLANFKIFIFYRMPFVPEAQRY